MPEKNFNVTVSDFSVYPKPAPVSYSISYKSVVFKLKKLFKHISDYDFWVLEHNRKIREKIKRRNNRRLNSARSASYKLSAPAYQNFDTTVNK